MGEQDHFEAHSADMDLFQWHEGHTDKGNQRMSPGKVTDPADRKSAHSSGSGLAGGT